MQGVHPRRELRRLRRWLRRRWERTLGAPSAGSGGSAEPASSEASGADRPVAPEPQKPEPKKPEPKKLELKAALRSIRWTDGGDLQLSGWAYIPGRDVDLAHTRLTVRAEDGSGHRVEATVQRRTDVEVDAIVENSQHDYAGGWFDAVFPADAWTEIVEPGFADQWLTVRLTFDDRGQQAVAGFRSRAATGSPGVLLSHAFDDGVFIRPVWQSSKGGLRIRIGRRAVLATAAFDDHGLELSITVRVAFSADRLRLAPAADQPGPEFGVEEDEFGRLRARIPFDRLDGALHGGTVCFPLLVGETGAVRHLHWQGVDAGNRLVAPTTPEIELQARPAGVWRLARRSRPAVIDGLRFEPGRDQLIISGHLQHPGEADRIVLTGPVDSRSAALQVAADGTFTSELDLIGGDNWGNTGLAPTSGTYHLQVVGPNIEPITLPVSVQAAAGLGQRRLSKLVSVEFQRTADDQLSVIIEPPLTAEERSKRGRQRLQQWSRQLDEPLRDAIFFEAFGGKFAACNPMAIMQRIVERGLPYDCYWCVRDHAVPIPEGGKPVLFGSAEWWRVRATSRFLVLNGWAHHTLAKRPGQQVLQTFHGTPYKKLAMDRSALRAPNPAPVRRESKKWDHLVVQSDYMAEKMASAYDYHGPVLRTGYPRDDVLSLPAGDEIRSSLRKRLGIGDDQLCILYAPTLRENRRQLVNELDVDRVAAQFGDRAVVLVRGHYTMSRRSRGLTGQTIDVTSYPQAEHLFLASDVAITDYSSIMFDYTAGGKPLLFFVPDLEEYASSVRGVYFDLAEIAPGPLLTSTDEVIDALQSLDTVQQKYREPYAAWVERFNPWDDGHAADRVIDAVFTGSGVE